MRVGLIERAIDAIGVGALGDEVSKRGEDFRAGVWMMHPASVGRNGDEKCVGGFLVDRNVELVTREAGDRQRDTQAFRVSVLARNPLDVVGRVAVGCLGNAIKRTLDLVKPKQEGT